MILTDEEKSMLDGKHGWPKQKSMEILVGLGECFDAERLIPIRSTHLPGGALIATGSQSGRMQFISEFADRGGTFATFADMNTTSVDTELWEYLGIPEEFVRQSNAYLAKFSQMGAQLCNTCTPYLIGHLPSFGEHVAWGESSAIIFVNSVIGARTNREGAPSAYAAAITGRTPAYGLHLDAERHGELKIVVDAKLGGPVDFGTLGYFAGKLAGMRTPVFTGLAGPVSWDEHKLLGAATANSGGSAMYHIVGITPEAPTEAAAFGPRAGGGIETHVFGERELRETEQLLDKSQTPEVDIVVVGCPNASIAEITEVAQLLEGKRVHENTQLWLFTSRPMKAYAEKMGYLKTIESAGGKIVCEACTATMPAGLLKKGGFKSPATNSAKMLYYLAGRQDLNSHYGSTRRVVQSAIDGIWS
ncbi:aconitase X catalytic domain-containing protein [Xylophilus sp. GW821-FHT01B05]